MTDDEARRIMEDQRVNDLLDDAAVVSGLIHSELNRAWRKFPRPTASAHEGYAIMAEEVDEMWDEVKRNNIARAREEAIQVAAMAIRFLVEVKE